MTRLAIAVLLWGLLGFVAGRLSAPVLASEVRPAATVTPFVERPLDQMYLPGLRGTR